MNEAPLIDWTAVVQSLTTTAVVVAVLGYVAREFFKSSVTHVFERQMEAYKAVLSQQLEESKANLTHTLERQLEDYKAMLAPTDALAKERREQARDLIDHLTRAGRRAHDLCEAPGLENGAPPDTKLVDALADEARKLEDSLYEAQLTLIEVSSPLHQKIHAHKNQLIALRKQAVNMRGSIDKGERDKAVEIGASLPVEGATLRKLSATLVNELMAFARPRNAEP